MVLLTPSAISVAISSTVVCIFTFLLFLSGYVLQQQTVKSLQDALHRPPEPKPAVTLPRKFWQQEEDDFQSEALEANERIIEIVQNSPEGIEQRILDSVQDQLSVGRKQSQDVATAIQEIGAHDASETTVSKILTSAPKKTVEPRLAYILALSSPQEICSALLFFKTQRENGLRSPSLVLLYPALWEADFRNPSYKTALGLMRNAQDSNHVILHPVEISSVWEGVSIESQLLGSLQRNWVRWNFDRSLYLRSPGLALDISKLDSALSSSSLKNSWVPLSSAPQNTPSILLLSAERNMMMVPRGQMRGLTAEAKRGSHDDHHSQEMEIEARLSRKKAAYVIFDQRELDHRKGEKDWYGGVFERFERGKKEFCAGTPFVVGDEDDKFALHRRGRGM